MIYYLSCWVQFYMKCQTFLTSPHKNIKYVKYPAFSLFQTEMAIQKLNILQEVAMSSLFPLQPWTLTWSPADGQSQSSHACYHPWTAGSAQRTHPFHQLSVPKWPLPLANRSHAGTHYKPAVTVPNTQLVNLTSELLTRSEKTDCKCVTWSQGSRAIWIMCIPPGEVWGHVYTWSVSVTSAELHGVEG